MRYWLEDVWHWNLNWIRPLRARENLMLHRLMFVLNLVVIYRTNEDKLIWEWGKEGEYTINSFMFSLDKRIFVETKPYAIDAWKSFCPLKTEMTLWLALNEDLCTRAFLIRRYILSPQDDYCPFCEHHSETVSHILMHCPVVWKLWNKIVA